MSKTVEEARKEMDDLLLDGESVICPVCDQHAKIYKRRVNSSMARGLISMFLAFGTDFGYLQDVRRQHGESDNREESKLRFWELVEEDPRRRDDGGRAGYWRVTDKGVAWLDREITIPKYVLLYNNEMIDYRDPQVTIDDCLGKNFRLDELMAATP